MGFERRPAAVRAGDRRPRLDAARHPRADPLLRRRRPRARSTSTSARRARCGWTSRARSSPVDWQLWRSSSPRSSAASPSTRPPTATRWPATSRCWPPTSRPTRRCRRSREAIADGAERRSTATRTRPTPRCARRCSDRYGVPGQPHRDRQRLVRHPARRRRGAARAGRGDRLRLAVASASTRTSRRPRAPARSRSPLDDEPRARPRRDAAPRSPSRRGWSSSATRTTRRRPRCRSTRSPTFVAAGPDARRGDPRRGLLRVQPARRPRRRRSTCSTEHPNLVLLRTFSKVYGLCGLRVGYALCGSRDVRQRRRPGPPAVLLQRRRAGGGDRGAQAPGRGRRARRAQPRRAHRRSTTGLRELGIEPAESQANFVWFDLPGGRRGARRSSRASPSAASSCAPARRSAARARCASRTGRRSRTSASSPRSASCWPSPALLQLVADGRRPRTPHRSTRAYSYGYRLRLAI